MAAPIYSVSPQMGSNLIIVVFAVVVIGGMGSIRARSSPDSGGHHRGADQVFFPRPPTL
jgi:branched-chain amino acid transport system permease protein